MGPDFRYRRLGYVALDVGDLSRVDAFYRDMIGLAAAGTGLDGERLYRCGNNHHDLVLAAAARPGLRRVGWEMASADDLARLRRHLAGLGLAIRDMDAEHCAALGLDQAFQVHEPTSGACFEYFAAMAQAAAPFEPRLTRIVRLGHVVLGVSDYAAAERFFVEHLNFRVSDRIDGAVTFLRCFPNPLHHSFGLGRAEVNRLHHVNFMVTDIDDIGRALHRAHRLGVPVVFGPGRHPPSESVFLYLLDPEDTTVEFSFGMEEFGEHDARAPRRLPLRPESIDYWGSQPDPRFGKGGLIRDSDAVPA